MSTFVIHPSALDEQTLWSQCEVRRQRRSGPGGQHRNKVETAVFLVHSPSGVEASASERRSQAANRTVALWRLRVKLAINVRCPVGVERQPSELWQSRLHGERIAISATHLDFPAMLAEALDIVAAENYDHVQAARRLGCTPSQLIRLAKKEPAALLAWNQARRALHLHDLC